MSLRAAFDTNGGDWAALFAQSTDQANQLRFGTAGLEAAANISNYARVASTGSVGDGLYPRYNSDRAKYGKGYVTWAPSATVGQQMYIGTNLGGGTHNSHSVAAGNVISGGLWALRSSGSAADTWRLRLYNIVAGTVIASSAAVTLSSSAFTRFTVSGTAAGATSQYALIFERVSGSDTTTLLLTGAMLVNGPTVPDWYNSGPTSLLGVLTDYWGGGRWGLGFVKAYQYVAPVGKADLTLMNADKRFSPEYASGPLYGMLLPNLLLQIGDPDYGIWWTGWTDSWAPEPGTNRDKKAKLSATDARRFFARSSMPIPVFIGLTEDEKVALVVDEITLPNTTSGAPTTTDGTTEWYPLSDGAHSVPVGEVGDYYGSAHSNDPDAAKIFADMMEAVQGRVWCGRAGGINARLSQGDDTPASYVDLAALWMDAGYGSGEIVNRCEVIVHKQKEESGSFTIWTMDETVNVPAGTTESFRVYFSTNTTNKIRAAADGLTLTHGPTGGGRSSSLTDYGIQSAMVNLINASGGALDFTSASITATALYSQLRQVAKDYEDSTSIASHGKLERRISTSYIERRPWGKRLARYIVNRFKDPRNEIPWVTMDADVYPAQVFGCYVGASVHATDAQTGHDDYYAVIGEQHTVQDGLTNHTVKLYLEPLYATSVGDTSAS
jgi:hypothetical protein